MRTTKENQTALTVLNYEGQKITFRKIDGVLMVNASEMAKPFKKRPSHFTRNKEIRAYIEKLTQVANLQLDQVSISNHGGENPGTWFCELLAIRFAQWLSPEFSVWVDVNIRNLLTAQKEPQALKGSETELLELANQPKTHKSEFNTLTLESETITFHISVHGHLATVVPDKHLPDWYITPLKNAVDRMHFVSRAQNVGFVK